MLAVSSGEPGAGFRNDTDGTKTLQRLRRAMRAIKWPGVVGLVDHRAVAVASARPNPELRELAAKVLPMLAPETPSE